MIQIKRAQCPSTLKARGGHTDRFRNKQVVRTLWVMQNNKCCYCEQLIPAEGHAKAVEHFHPKSIFKSQRNDWRNLLLACAQCNGKKSDKFPVLLSNNVDQPKIIYLKRKQKAEPAMIDPSNDKINPEDHLDYYLDMSGGTLVGQILERNKSLLGRTTIDVTNIDQSFIHKRRRIHVRTLMRALLELASAKDNGDEVNLQIGLLQFQNLMSLGNEFAGLSREFARKMRLDAVYGLTIPEISPEEVDA